MSKNNLTNKSNNGGDNSDDLAAELAKLIESPPVIVTENDPESEDMGHGLMYQKFAQQKAEERTSRKKKAETNPIQETKNVQLVDKKEAVDITSPEVNKEKSLIEELNLGGYETIPVTRKLIQRQGEEDAEVVNKKENRELESNTSNADIAKNLAVNAERNEENDDEEEKINSETNRELESKIKKRPSATKGFFTRNEGGISHNKVMIGVMLAVVIGYFLLLPGDNKQRNEKGSKGIPAKRLKSEGSGSLQASGLPEWEITNAATSTKRNNKEELTNLANNNVTASEEGQGSKITNEAKSESLPELIIPKTIEIGSNKNSNRNNKNGNSSKTSSNRGESTTPTVSNNEQEDVSERGGSSNNAANESASGATETTRNEIANSLTSVTKAEGFTKKFRAATPKAAETKVAIVDSESKPAAKFVTFNTTASLRLLEPARSGLTSSVKALVLQDVKSAQGEVVIPANSTAIIEFLGSNVQGRLVNDPRQAVNFLLTSGEEILAYGVLKGPDGLLGIAGKERKLKGGGGALGVVGRSVKRVGSTIGAVAIGGVEGAIVKDTIDETGLNSTISSNNGTVVEVKAGVVCTLNIQPNGRK